MSVRFCIYLFKLILFTDRNMRVLRILDMDSRQVELDCQKNKVVKLHPRSTLTQLRRALYALQYAM
jgi:hypothetical protein